MEEETKEEVKYLCVAMVILDMLSCYGITDIGLDWILTLWGLGQMAHSFKLNFLLDCYVSSHLHFYRSLFIIVTLLIEAEWYIYVSVI